MTSQRLLAIALSLALLIGAVLFYSRHNDFPIYYHPDEELKGVQMVSGDFNFHHPLLLLDTGRIILAASGLPRTKESAVLCGRWASAIFTALSLLALATLAFRRAGWLGAILAAILIGLQPLLYELSHYCKEDPALLLGISLTLLALDLFAAKPTLWRGALLGAACGVAVSGKYLGAVMIFVALPWVVWKGKQAGSRSAVIGLFAGGLAFALLLINFPMLLNPQGLFGAFGFELNAAQVGGAKGLTREVPHAKYVGVFLENVSWPLWIGLACFLLGWFLRKSQRRGSDLVCLVLPLIYATLLSFSPKTANRYFLAVSPFLILCASIGFVWLGQFLSGKQRILGYAALLLLAGLAIRKQFAATNPIVRSFRTDSRMEMAKWIAENLPQGSPILAETRLGLTRPETWSRTQQRTDLVLTDKLFAPDFGEFGKLKADGIRYVGVMRTSFGGYLSDHRKASKDQESQHQHRADFYTSLFKNARLLKQTGGSGVAHLNPELRLYELPAQ